MASIEGTPTDPKNAYLFKFAFSIPNLTYFLELCTYRVLLPIFSLSLLSNLSLSYSDSLKQIYSLILISCFFFRAYSNYSTAWIIICSKSFSNFPSIPLCPQRSYVQSLSKSTSANMSHHWRVSACGQNDEKDYFINELDFGNPF